MGIEDQQQFTSKVWDDLYRKFEPGKPVGKSYPSEALVIFVSNLRKGRSVEAYFDDSGQEHSIKRDFTGNALEMGFGTIANLKMVREKGFQCFGLEVSEETVARGEMAIGQQGLDGIRLSHWQPYDIPFPDNFFSLVYGLECIYYNLEIEKVIREIFRVMRPGGSFLFSFFSSAHSYIGYLEHVSGRIYRWSDSHPNARLRGANLIQPNSKEEVARLFARFEDIRVFTTESDQTPLVESWWYVTGGKPDVA